MAEKKKLVLVVVGNDTSVDRIVRARGHEPAGIAQIVNGTYDGVIFTGGGDINPYLYGEGLHSSTRPDYQRDLRELAILRRIPINKPKIGICRGAQLLNVYSGGGMIQDVDNHVGTHKARCLISNKDVFVNSLHHQMMRPSNHAWILMTAGVSSKWSTYHGDIQVTHDREDLDIEACWYSNTNSYCYQGHPEYDGCPEGREIFWDHCDMVFHDEWYKQKKEVA